MNSNDPADFDRSPPTESTVFESVILDLDEDEVGDFLTGYLNKRKSEIEHLCDEFIASDSQGRFTVDEDSLEVESVFYNPSGYWEADCHFTVSAYYGCRDMNVDGADCDCTILLTLDVNAQTLVAKVRKTIRRDTFEEF